jgi:histidine triad (HIT) family protein
MESCIFCEIIKGNIPCSKVYEDDQVLAFDDIHPMAPVHVLVIPKIHIPTLMDVSAAQGDILLALGKTVQLTARKKGVAESGFRTVINCNEEGGQIVPHLHIHILGGVRLKDDLG